MKTYVRRMALNHVVATNTHTHETECVMCQASRVNACVCCVTLPPSGASQQGDKEVSTVAFHEPPVRAGFFRAVYILLKYRAVKNYSSMEYVAPRLGDKILFALLILSLYWGIGDDEDVQSQQSTASLLYFVVALCGYGAAAVVPSLTLERPLFIRERNDGCYTAGAYWTYKLTEEAVLTMLTSFLFAVVVFWSCKLQGSFWVFVVDYYLCAMTGTVLAYAIASAVPTMEAANALLPTYVTTCMYFGGMCDHGCMCKCVRLHESVLTANAATHDATIANIEYRVR